MHLTLHLTDACNLACSYCYVNQSIHTMSPETARAAVDLAAGTSGHCGIIFFGGEPLLQRQLIYDTVAYAESLNLSGKFHYKITTNGTLLDNEFLMYSQAHQIFIALSHDGIAHDRNRRTHDGAPTREIVDRAARLLLQYRPYAPVMMTVAPNSVTQYAQGVQYLYDLGFRYLICSLDYAGDWTDSQLGELKRQYSLLAEWYKMLTLREEKFYFSPFEVKISSHIRQSTHCTERCELGKKQISVSPAGRLYPCVQFVGKEDFCIGNVWNGINQAAQLRLYHANEVLQQPCADCAIQTRCNHHCACLNQQSTGNFRQVSPVLCAHERLLLPIADRLAEELYRKRSAAFIQKQYNDMYPLLSYLEDRERSAQYAQQQSI